MCGFRPSCETIWYPHDRRPPLTHLCRVDSSILASWKGPFPRKERVSSCFLLLPRFMIDIPAFNANSVDPDQTPRSAASDLGPHCLSLSILWD